jgi:hypothetical protein
MNKFYFDLVGDFAASDLVGHDCANEEEARAHGRFIAHRIGTEKPQMVRAGNYISVRDEGGYEILSRNDLDHIRSGALMPRYHFDLVDHQTVQDEGGQELSDDAKAAGIADELARRPL